MIADGISIPQNSQATFDSTKMLPYINKLNIQDNPEPTPPIELNIQAQKTTRQVTPNAISPETAPTCQKITIKTTKRADKTSSKLAILHATNVFMI